MQPDLVPFRKTRSDAGIAQLAERQPSKLNVAGSSPVSRSMQAEEHRTDRIHHMFLQRDELQEDSGGSLAALATAHVAQSAEHVLGKDGVTGSSPVVGSPDQHRLWRTVNGQREVQT